MSVTSIAYGPDAKGELQCTVMHDDQILAQSKKVECIQSVLERVLKTTPTYTYTLDFDLMDDGTFVVYVHSS